jgi:glycosyltransferase involved in cell wall biosynthesis
MWEKYKACSYSRKNSKSYIHMKTIGVDCFGLTRPLYTGKEVYIHGLIESLLEQTNIFSFTAFYPKNTERKPEWISHNVTDFPTKSLSSYTAWSQIILPFAVRKAHPDVMIFTESMLPLVPLVATIRKIVIIYDVMYLHVPNEFDPKTRRILHHLMPHTIKEADVIVTISESSKNDIVRYYDANPDKIHVVYPCVSGFDSNTHYLKDEIKKELSIQGKMVTYAGNHYAYKNIENLLYAFKSVIDVYNIKDATLVLVGKKEKRTKIIEEKIQSLGLKDRVKITGYVDRVHYEKLIKASDAFILPSLYEGFGIPLIEAMASGVPVVTSNIGAMAEVVGNAGKLFNPRDSANIAQCLASVLLDNKLSTEMIVKGINRVKEFQWSRSTKVMERILNNLLEQ